MVPLSGYLALVYSCKCFPSGIFLLPTAQCDIVLEIREGEDADMKVFVSVI